ncbi:MAG: hypothetical protein HC837_06485 [Chloroflexaceae bacterium]|nr:hypothetical protein [Chloroflexaceae bacterium]
MDLLLRAAFQPLLIAVLVASIAAGTLIWLPLLYVGIVVYVIGVVMAVRDPSLAAKARTAELSGRISSRAFRGMIQEIERSQRNVDEALGQTSGVLAQRLQETVGVQSKALVEQAYTLAEKGQFLEQYLSQVNEQQLQNEIKQLDMRIAQTTDQHTLDQFKETRKTMVARLNNARSLKTLIERISAQLQNIDANLDNVRTEIIRLHATGVDATMASEQVARHLGDLNTDMDAFKRVLDTEMVESGATTRL